MRILRHSWTRQAAQGVLALPFVLFLVLLYQHRQETIAQLVQAHRPALAALGVTGFLGLLWRRRILDVVDRRFFRAEYNARRILTQLVAQVRSVHDLRELARLVTRGIDLALDLERVALLVQDPDQGRLVDPQGTVRPLDQGSAIATLALGNKDPVEVDLESGPEQLKRLPLAEQHWLVDTRARMLTPAFGADGSLIGLVVLGRKTSGAPFFKQDRQLLTAIGASAGLAIEFLQLRDRTPVPPVAAPRVRNAAPTPIDPAAALQRAMECLRCNRVFPSGTPACDACGQELRRAQVPYMLRGQFRFEECIGSGGMAVVYRAIDLKLARTVAIKTLPRVSPEAAIKLHREARAAAALSHPGLAAIYGIETSEGTPMLILELLEGGTLADRLAKGPVAPREVLRTGESVALALDALHGAGILHRDIKPSNIGYTRDGTPKLLDFGIARIDADVRRERAARGGEPADWYDLDPTTTGNIAGTICYQSPELLRGARPDRHLDLWSLAVVLYEALVGENLFFGHDLARMLAAIRHAEVPDLRMRLPGCPETLALFFRRALHRDRERRPQSGREMQQLLAAVQRSLPVDAPR